MPGTLYLVATPIGNLEDMSFRAVRILKEADLVAAEDTRHSRKLFSHYGISTSLTSYYSHNEEFKGESLLEALREGRSVALISDAGMPTISDPGFLLVRRCREEQIPVTAVPGPSAVVTALAIAGLPTERFVFEGFLPARSQARKKALQQFSGEARTTVFYEAPHRLLSTLRDMASVLGENREVAVARELTKVHEELFRGTLAETLAHFSQGRVRGEIVLLLAPAEKGRPSESVPEALQRWFEESDLSMKEIVKVVAREHGCSGSDVYREALRLKGKREG